MAHIQPFLAQLHEIWKHRPQEQGGVEQWHLLTLVKNCNILEDIHDFNFEYVIIRKLGNETPEQILELLIIATLEPILKGQIQDLDELHGGLIDSGHSLFVLVEYIALGLAADLFWNWL